MVPIEQLHFVRRTTQGNGKIRMIFTIFRSRLDPAQAGNYVEVAKAMKVLVEKMPGLVSHKTFESKDGERLTVVEFADEESHNAWRDLPAHRNAMELGRTRFYEEYKVQICELKRESSFRRESE